MVKYSKALYSYTFMLIDKNNILCYLYTIKNYMGHARETV